MISRVSIFIIMETLLRNKITFRNFRFDISLHNFYTFSSLFRLIELGEVEVSTGKVS